jgi:hypothetical protein
MRKGEILSIRPRISYQKLLKIFDQILLLIVYAKFRFD